MSLTAAVKCRVHITTPAVYPGDPVEGFVELEALHPFPVSNIHVKIVGKEQIHTMVDHVSQGKTADQQFGISSQDYIYYREIVTLAGDLLTQKRDSKSSTPRFNPPAGAAPDASVANDGVEVDEEIAQRYLLNSPGTNNNSMAEGSAAAVTMEAEQLQRSFAMTELSVLAHRESTRVIFPQGKYIFPLRFLLPSELPPSYDTGVHVRDKQFSNSIAKLTYYIKLYVLSTKRQLATSSAIFTVKCMQPAYNNKTFLGCRKLRLSPDARLVELRLALRGGFGVGGCCGGGGGGSGKKDVLVVKFMIDNSYYEIDKDIVKVVCVVVHNNTGKAMHGVRLSLVQTLTFQTVEAKVPMSSAVLTKDTKTKVEPGAKNASIAATLPRIPIQADLLPTMATSGLQVSYAVRAELLLPSGLVTDPHYEFQGIVLAGHKEAMEMAPSGQMDFPSLPRGRLSKREAYYAVPSNPAVPAELPVMETSSALPTPFQSRAPSRRVSALKPE